MEQINEKLNLSRFNIECDIFKKKFEMAKHRVPDWKVIKLNPIARFVTEAKRFTLSQG